ncbi:MAG: nitrilase-related carbon-nitrogen hydrolase, partial [Terriglobia bacterium]
MKIALAQINTTVGDFDGNAKRILSFAERAHERRADIAVFPELAMCGYPPRDLVERPDFIELCESKVKWLSEHLPPIPVLLGYVRRSGV